MVEPTITNRLDVINRIKGWINSGQLPPNSAMPTERELCERLSTQRLTISRALASLEEEGVIRRIGRRTRVVAERPRAMANSIVLVNSVRYQSLLASMHKPGWAVMMSVGTLAEVSDRNYNLTLIHPDRMTTEELENLIKGRPLGVVFPEQPHDFSDKPIWLAALKKAGIPVVTYGEDPESTLYDHVSSNHEVGSYNLTKHLLGLGRRRPLLFYSVAYPMLWVKARYAGYERAMHDAGLEPMPMAMYPPTPIMAPPGTQEQFEAMRRHTLSYLIDHVGPGTSTNKVDALLVATDGHLYPAWAACRSLGVKPGADILLAGYDNYWEECWEHQFEQIAPSATVDKRNTEAGRMLVRLLLDRTSGLLAPEPQEKIIESELITYPG